MPTYEYQCGACGAKFEQFQRMSDDPIKICPQCGKSSVKRLMSTGVGVVFKGSGFYVTDYRDASYAKAESTDHSQPTSTPQISSKSPHPTDSTASPHHSTSATNASCCGTSGGQTSTNDGGKSGTSTVHSSASVPKAV